MTGTRVRVKPEEMGGRGKMMDGGEVALGATRSLSMPILVVKRSDDIIPSMEGLTTEALPT